MFMESELFFGEWEQGESKKKLDLDRIGWRSNTLSLKKRSQSRREFNKVMVIFNVINDGLLKHDGNVFLREAYLSPIG